MVGWYRTWAYGVIGSKEVESASTETEVLYDVEDLLRFRNISCKKEEKVRYLQ
jgi:hypothetical protein